MEIIISELFLFLRQGLQGRVMDTTGPRVFFENAGKEKATDDGISLFVIDDDEGVREVLSHHLSSCYNVVLVEDPFKIFSKISTTTVGAIILDLYIPGVDSLEVLKLLKMSGFTSRLPVVCVTADRNSRAALLSLDLGATTIIQKPFNLANLREQIDEVLKVNYPAN